MKLREAFETIVSYCAEQDCCEECHFFDEGEDACFFALSNLPCDWEWDKLKEVTNG